MNAPMFLDSRTVTEGITLVPLFAPVPGLGVLAVNAFVIRAREPVLVDAGIMALKDGYFSAISGVIDPTDLRWIVLTHIDPDHVGCLDELLDAAPRAKVVTNFLGMAKLGLRRPLPPDRVHLLNPGQSLNVGDRELHALRPPVFDAPETMGFFDSKTRALISSDCFGALLAAPAENAASIRDAELEEGLIRWATVDAPWLSLLDAAAFGGALRAVSDLAPSTILSSHLPPADGMLEHLLCCLDKAREAPPFVGPDQQALLALLSG